MKKISPLILLLILPFSFCYPETIKLKSGKTIEADIVERGDDYIRVDVVGVPITYYFEDIESIDGIVPRVKKETQQQSYTTTTVDIPRDRIRKQLKELGYPEHTWPDIERELTAFLTKINFPRLQKEAERVKSDPAQLKNFISEIDGLIGREGCMNTQSPHPLIVLLVNSLGTEDIFQVAEASLGSSPEKEEFRRLLVACSAVSQLASIILDLLDFNVKVAISPAHVFNCIPLDDRRILFIDFSNQIFEIVDITQYYKLEGKYWVLKGEYRFSPDRVREIKKQWQQGVRADSLKEVFNYPYSCIYITDDYTATGAIYYNRGFAYYKKGDYDQAIADYSQALRINSNFAAAYNNRGIAYDIKGDYNQAIADYNQALRINPNDAKAYCNRGFTYYKKGELDQAIADYNQALGIDSNYAEAYRNRGFAYADKGDYNGAIADYNQALRINPNDAEVYCNRGIVYIDTGDLNQAIADFNQALGIDPNLAEAYNNRAIVYCYRGDYTKAWEDVRKAQALGFQINPEFLQYLRQASGRDR